VISKGAVAKRVGDQPRRHDPVARHGGLEGKAVAGMRLRRRSLFVLAALLGAAVAVMPAVAGSETGPSITAENPPPSYHAWNPTSVTVSPGGSVAIANPTTVAHGVYWYSGPATPTCSPSVPVGTTAASSGIEWSGSCTFPTAGTYTFYCTVHGPSMAATVHVETGGGTTTTSTSTTPPGTTGTTPGTGTGGSPTTPGAAGGGGAGSPTGAASGLKLSFARRSSAVSGSVQVAGSGAGGRLEVDLLARRASLARTGAPVSVGRLVRTSLPAGTVGFRVPLSARGRSALRRHHRLALTVKVTVTPVTGAATAIARALTLHR
jgi:plastocyanin